MKTLTLILLLAAFVYCQTKSDAPEFGELSEIVGMSKVYVYSEDLKVRQQLVDQLKKEPMFEVVGDSGEANFAMFYTWSGLTTRNIFGARTNAYKGDLMVYTRGRHDQSVNRIVWSLQVSRKTTLSKNPADKAIEQFIKDYKTAQRAKK